MTLTPDGRVTIPVDLAECKVELLGGRHSATLELWVLPLCDEVEMLREEKLALLHRLNSMEEQVRELERKQFVSDT